MWNSGKSYTHFIWRCIPIIPPPVFHTRNGILAQSDANSVRLHWHLGITSHFISFIIPFLLIVCGSLQSPAYNLCTVWIKHDKNGIFMEIKCVCVHVQCTPLFFVEKFTRVMVEGWWHIRNESSKCKYTRIVVICANEAMHTLCVCVCAFRCTLNRMSKRAKERRSVH